MDKPVIIIGGGLTGLTTAIQLHQANKPYLLIEAKGDVGGRVATDVTDDGYLLDHGFQVYLTAYPDAKEQLSYGDLDLKRFKPGAIILREDGKMSKIGDPLRDPSSAIATIFSGIGTLSDKVKILKLKSHVAKLTVDQIFEQSQGTTIDRLTKHYGFSTTMIDLFFKPFFRGIFLEDDLSTDYRMFEFVFKMFGEGHAALPSKGMRAIPAQLADKLDADHILINTKVESIDGNYVTLTDGKRIEGSRVVIATEEVGFLDRIRPVKTQYRTTTNIYFAAKKPLSIGAYIALNPTVNGIVNNICDVTAIAGDYSTSDQLISITLRDSKQNASITDVKEELSKWFVDAKQWKHIKTYKIKYALPNQDKVSNMVPLIPVDGPIIAGDHLLNGSINAAMKLGQAIGKALV